jgi:hypothetical protein
MDNGWLMSCVFYDAVIGATFAIRLNRSSVFYDFLFPWASSEYAQILPNHCSASDTLDDEKNGAVLNHGRQKDGSGSDSRVMHGLIILRIAIGSKNGLSCGGDNGSV